MPARRTFALTALALTGFAANSLLCRAALRPRAIDPSSFTLIRLASGAAVLALLLRASSPASGARREGSWRAGIALVAYAITFSFAYVSISAAVGALILFGVVQLTMIAGGVRAGERPRRMQSLGLAIAFAGLVALNLPGLERPDPLGAGLMAIAGVAWGVYSLLGRGCARPLAATADNFARSVPFAAAASLVALSHAHATWRGAALAIASGALASGVGYCVWYAALKDLGATRAGIVQLCVPVLAAAGSVALLGEPATPRLLAAGATILLGVGLAIVRR
jgi:drug/metabolite transporter (DMT)-like permease